MYMYIWQRVVVGGGVVGVNLWSINGMHIIMKWTDGGSQ